MESNTDLPHAIQPAQRLAPEHLGLPPQEQAARDADLIARADDLAARIYELTGSGSSWWDTPAAAALAKERERVLEEFARETVPYIRGIDSPLFDFTRNDWFLPVYGFCGCTPQREPDYEVAELDLGFCHAGLSPDELIEVDNLDTAVAQPLLDELRRTYPRYRLLREAIDRLLQADLVLSFVGPRQVPTRDELDAAERNVMAAMREVHGDE